MRGDSQLSQEPLGLGCLAQGHLDPLGGAGDRTGSRPVKTPAHRLYLLGHMPIPLTTPGDASVRSAAASAQM